MVSKTTLGAFALFFFLGWFLIPTAIFVLVASFFFRKSNTVLGRPYNIVYDWFFYQSEAPRKFLWKWFYNIICRLYPQPQWSCMNYGYAQLDSRHSVNLLPEDEPERYCFQLYHLVATGFGKWRELSNKKILEVGCGRGGGLSFVTRYLKPSEVHGLDYSEQQVEFCAEKYRDQNITFQQGDAEHLPFGDASFDVVINVESSHCYGNFENFVKEVARVLKPGGFFCMTDFRSDKDVEAMTNTLAKHMLLTDTRDITENVLRALELDETRRLELINSKVHSFLRPTFIKFSGLKGSTINDAMHRREVQYWAYVLQKPVS